MSFDGTAGSGAPGPVTSALARRVASDAAAGACAPPPGVTVPLAPRKDAFAPSQGPHLQGSLHHGSRGSVVAGVHPRSDATLMLHGFLSPKRATTGKASWVLQGASRFKATSARPNSMRQGMPWRASGKGPARRVHDGLGGRVPRRCELGGGYDPQRRGKLYAATSSV